MDSQILLGPGFASGKEQRGYMFDGFTDTASPGICFQQGVEAVHDHWVYDQWVPGYCWAWDLFIAKSYGGI